MAWGVFLDRDGTLVPNVHYPVHPRQLTPYPGASSALTRLRSAGAELIVVSNQSAVGRGFLTPEGLEAMDKELRRLFAPVRFRATYYCPHQPADRCACRKPGTRLISRGLAAAGVSAEDAYLVGDSASDMEAGRRAGLHTVLVLTGNGRRDRARCVERGWVDKVTARLATAADYILKHRLR